MTPVADRGEFRFVTKSGEIRVALLFTKPIMHHDEPAILMNLVDISEKQRFEDKIQLDNERRRGIIITVAHELRTPLQPILGYLNLLVQDPEGFGIIDDTKKILERCLVSVERERQIINQMLDLSGTRKWQASSELLEIPPLNAGQKCAGYKRVFLES